MKGTVANLLTNKYYGFIAAENGQEYFFHKEDLNGDWQQLCQDWKSDSETIKVSFEPSSTSKGPRARNVNLIQHV
jgi:cold shock CspA family protein